MIVLFTTTTRLFCILFLAGVLTTAYSQEDSLFHKSAGDALSFDVQAPRPFSLAPSTIIAQFLQSEAQVREALNQHTFKRDVVLQTIGRNGEVTGEYIRNSQFLFDDQGNRIERVTFHPPSTIRELRITKEDIQDLAGAQLLGIDIGEAGKYQLSYESEETLNGKRVFVLHVEPARKPDPHRMHDRYFIGSIWIDANRFQIVKVKGKVEPQGKQRFPVFQTWREPLSTNLYLPTRTEADDILHFRERDVNYRIRVRYYDYKLFGSKLKITEIGPAN